MTCLQQARCSASFALANCFFRVRSASRNASFRLPDAAFIRDLRLLTLPCSFVTSVCAASHFELSRSTVSTTRTGFVISVLYNSALSSQVFTEGPSAHDFPTRIQWLPGLTV